jgi:hypothetical protein
MHPHSRKGHAIQIADAGAEAHIEGAAQPDISAQA